MPCLRKYVNSNAYYIKEHHNGVYSTFQLSSEAYEYLQASGLLRNGCDIGRSVFFYLHENGWVYTGGGGHDIVPLPPPPELSVQHLWFLNLTGLSLLVRNVLLKNMDYSGPAKLRVNKSVYTGEVRQHRLNGLPSKGISLWNIMPCDASIDIELQDDRGNYLADALLDPLEGDVMLFKSGRARREELIEIAADELMMECPKGVCLLSSEDSLPSAKGGLFEEITKHWKDFRLYRLRSLGSVVPRITVTTEKRKWILDVGTPLELSCRTPLVMCKGDVEFTGSRVFPVFLDDPMNVELVHWNNDEEFLDSVNQAQLLVETETSTVAWSLPDLVPHVYALNDEGYQFSLRQLLLDKAVPFSAGPIRVSLEGCHCREDITVCFFRIPEVIEVSPSRIGERAFLMLEGYDQTVKSERPLCLADGTEKKRVIGHLQRGESQTLDISWFPIIEEAVLLVDGEPVTNGSILDIALLQKHVEIAFLPCDDRVWTVKAGDTLLTHVGKGRLLLRDMIRRICHTSLPRTVQVTASVQNNVVSCWSISTFPSVIQSKTNWGASSCGQEHYLTVCLSLYGLLEPSLRFYLLVDGHRIHDLVPQAMKDVIQPGEHEYTVQFGVSESLLTIIHRAGDIRVEAVLDERILWGTSVVPFPFSVPPREAGVLRNEIRDLIHQLQGDEEGADLSLERILYLTEEYVSATKSMPFQAATLSQQCGMGDAAAQVSVGLMILEALLSRHVLLTALPTTAGVEGKLALYVQSLRVFYEVFLFAHGKGNPGRLSSITTELRSAGIHFDNEYFRAWAISVAAYGEAMGLNTPVIKGERTLASERPLITFYKPFLDWLSQE